MTEAELEAFFYEAKEQKKVVRIVDRWDQVYEGRLYRNGFDRTNVVSVLGSSHFSVERYYMDIKAAEIIGDEPQGLPDFFTDWNRKTRS